MHIRSTYSIGNALSDMMLCVHFLHNPEKKTKKRVRHGRHDTVTLYFSEGSWKTVKSVLCVGWRVES